MDISVRPETPQDAQAIYDLTQAAFSGRPYAGGDEQEVVDRLRQAGALTLSLVACFKDELIGHIAFSPTPQPDAPAPWFALGPVSVLPAYQKQGVGSTLIQEGLRQIQALGAAGCILTGDPQYYPRFGFELAPQYAPNNEPAEYFMLIQFDEQGPTERFAFHPAFYG